MVNDITPAIGATALAEPTDFHGLDGIIHLAAAGETPFLVRQRALFERFMNDKAGGMSGRERIYDVVEGVRDSVARLMEVQREEIGFPLNAAQGFNTIARAIGEHGNVVMPQWEYPSAMYPFITGSVLEVRLVSNNRYEMDTQQFADAVDENTRAIVVSLVSYFTGERIDLKAYREIADRSGAMLIVDISHALGVGRFDASLIDFAFSCGYKWALGTHGAGIAYCNKARQANWLPKESGWMSAEWIDAGVRDKTVAWFRDGRRFEFGNPAALPVQILGAGIDYLHAKGIDQIELHVLALTTLLRQGLADLGLDMLTPAPEQRRLGIVAFGVEDEAAWREHLESRGVLAWAGDKRLRISPHLYNSRKDIEVALEVIAEFDASRKATRRPRRQA